jgi:hypothetical protein
MYLVIVFLLVILPMLWLSSKLKRNLIIAQNLTSFTTELIYRVCNLKTLKTPLCSRAQMQNVIIIQNE